MSTTLGDVILYDILANRPTASIKGRLFFATDTSTWYRDNGTSWNAIITGGSAINFSDNDPIVGAIDGVNTTFTLAHTPNPAKSLKFYLNGNLLQAGVHYTLYGNTVTLVSPPQPASANYPGDYLEAYFRY